jgi:hypothetical protein
MSSSGRSLLRRRCGAPLRGSACDRCSLAPSATLLQCSSTTSSGGCSATGDEQRLKHTDKWPRWVTTYKMSHNQSSHPESNWWQMLCVTSATDSTLVAEAMWVDAARVEGVWGFFSFFISFSIFLFLFLFYFFSFISFFLFLFSFSILVSFLYFFLFLFFSIFCFVFLFCFLFLFFIYISLFFNFLFLFILLSFILFILFFSFTFISLFFLFIFLFSTVFFLFQFFLYFFSLIFSLY